MIIPSYWAEASLKQRIQTKQVTVKRFGWSNVSQQDAQAQAQTRAQDALSRILKGEKLNRRESKIAYNGADGLPIREEVLARHGEQVITRNSYGAHCLNSPDVFFVDVDYESALNTREYSLAILVFSGALLPFAVWLQSWWLAAAIVLVSFVLGAVIVSAFKKMYRALNGGFAALAIKRIRKAIQSLSDWSIRVYETPAGIRLIVTHRLFDPSESAVQSFFQKVAADPLYKRMCLNQKCFRARLTAKPWRIGIGKSMQPHPGVWPVHPERLPIRQKWVSHYETKAQEFASCRYVMTLGTGVIHVDVAPVIELHDRLSKATETNRLLA
jgi:hypothetical protein